jgi:signal peptidase II
LSLGAQLPAELRTRALVGVNLLIAAALAAVIAAGSHMTRLGVAGCALLLAGALGNLIDRLRFDGLVIDFLNLGVGPLRSGIFNVADLAITAGALLLVLPATFGQRPVTPVGAPRG